MNERRPITLQTPIFFLPPLLTPPALLLLLVLILLLPAVLLLLLRFCSEDAGVRRCMMVFCCVFVPILVNYTNPEVAILFLHLVAQRGSRFLVESNQDADGFLFRQFSGTDFGGWMCCLCVCVCHHTESVCQSAICVGKLSHTYTYTKLS